MFQTTLLIIICHGDPLFNGMPLAIRLQYTIRWHFNGIFGWFCVCVVLAKQYVSRSNQTVKVGLYFRRRQAPLAPPHEAPVRSISWRGPAGVKVRQCRGKKYKRTRV